MSLGPCRSARCGCCSEDRMPIATTISVHAKADARAAVTSADDDGAGARSEPPIKADENGAKRDLGEDEWISQGTRDATIPASVDSQTDPVESRVNALIPNSSPAPAAISPGTRMSDCQAIPARAAMSPGTTTMHEGAASQWGGPPNARVVHRHEGERRERAIRRRGNGSCARPVCMIARATQGPRGSEVADVAATQHRSR